MEKLTSHLIEFAMTNNVVAKVGIICSVGLRQNLSDMNTSSLHTGRSLAVELHVSGNIQLPNFMQIQHRALCGSPGTVP